MKAIDFAKGLKKKLTSNLAPISKGEMNLLVDILEKEQAGKPTVVIHLEDGLISGITSSCEVQAIKVDYDVEGVDSNASTKETPYGSEAFVEFAAVDCLPEEIDEWVALANQE